jgi:DNA-binding LacI/PurR family transcriptional regulator
LIRSGTFRASAGYEHTNALLKLPDPPTAIFAGSDLQAAGAYQALREHGLSIPSDMSIVGFDDVPLANLMSPPLTTIRQPLAQMGKTAVDMLLRSIEGQTPDPARVELATNLLERESCAPVVPAARPEPEKGVA